MPASWQVRGGRLEKYKSRGFAEWRRDRDARQAQVVATAEAQERERKRLQDFIDRMGAKASKARQAKDRQGKLDRLQIDMEATAALLVTSGRRPKLSLAPPPACGSERVGAEPCELGLRQCAGGSRTV